MHSEAALKALSEAGWRPDRSQPPVQRWINRLQREDGFRPFPSAVAALRGYGGLRVPMKGGVRHGLNLDPTLAVGEMDRFTWASRELDTSLYPLGEASEGHAFLAIDPSGRVYALMMEVWLVGASIQEAIECLVTWGEWRSIPVRPWT